TSRPFWLINPGHQHPGGAVGPKLDFADGKIEPGGGTVRGRVGCMDDAGPERAHSGQTCRARGGGHQPENVTPNESAFVQVCLPQNDLVAATIGSSQTSAMSPSTNSGRRVHCADSSRTLLAFITLMRPAPFTCPDHDRPLQTLRSGVLSIRREPVEPTSDHGPL